MTEFDFNTAIQELRGAHSKEWNATPPGNFSDVLAARKRQNALSHDYQLIAQEFQKAMAGLKDWPKLPPAEEMQWATNVLKMPNLLFMEIDTTGLEISSEITRILLLNSNGDTYNEWVCAPEKAKISDEAARVSGIDQAYVDEVGLSLRSAWNNVVKAFQGKYVVSFNLKWDIDQLNNAAVTYGLEPVSIIGECLQQRARHYYDGSYGLKLEEICRRVGQPLPKHPGQNAVDRAYGQIAFVHAMVQGIRDVPNQEQEPKPIEHAPAPDDLGDLDDHPF